MGTFYIRRTDRTPGYQITADNWNELNGDLNELNKRLVFQIPAESWKPRSGGVIIEPDGTREDYRATFAENATGVVTFGIHVPQDFIAIDPSPLELHISWHAGDSASIGNVRWAGSVELVQAGASLNSPRASTPVLSTGTTLDGEDLTVTPIIIPGNTLTALPEFPGVVPLRPGDLLRIVIERRGSATEDTIPGDVYLLNVFGRLQASGPSQIP